MFSLTISLKFKLLLLIITDLLVALSFGRVTTSSNEISRENSEVSEDNLNGLDNDNYVTEGPGVTQDRVLETQETTPPETPRRRGESALSRLLNSPPRTPPPQVNQLSLEQAQTILNLQILRLESENTSKSRRYFLVVEARTLSGELVMERRINVSRFMELNQNPSGSSSSASESILNLNMDLRELIQDEMNLGHEHPVKKEQFLRAVSFVSTSNCSSSSSSSSSSSQQGPASGLGLKLGFTEISKNLMTELGGVKVSWIRENCGGLCTLAYAPRRRDNEQTPDQEWMIPGVGQSRFRLRDNDSPLLCRDLQGVRRVLFPVESQTESTSTNSDWVIPAVGPVLPQNLQPWGGGFLLPWAPPMPGGGRFTTSNTSTQNLPGPQGPEAASTQVQPEAAEEEDTAIDSDHDDIEDESRRD